MRVISGTAKGRQLKAVPGKGTRPTTDKVKEAMFSMIGPYFDGGLVLDLFAGTGGLGIEALSRGMDKAIFIDMDPKAIEVIRHNVQAAGVGIRSEIYRNDARRALKALAKRGTTFDLVFMDPPYRLTDADTLLTDMMESDLIANHATIVMEHDTGHEYPEQIGLFVIWKKANYGETTLTMYQQRPRTEHVDSDM
ncbi:16S rRNA (guanine(966)-N(2))-methyltransferase RsmD [Paenibacillus sp. ACRRX]|uniref:16S rRNA (guanine(966)-N(2))-methyltransferase RsmD n=1 Tax=unclassified Paenibacillus TaxID=185978 RepID=UPI001EF54F6F|nr:16S rRNA (guanine(966)-N(2))-methyltransferase RsmD [Paenibacillus sp. UMB4589-SE434]MCG7407550.1 16S rRNA (guanine(966)-N(2))-methyltransferase RsmD [Paenibacillus sp. ACRRX]MDK8180785.1 16S rRNA (guanine(966)-N(2))-methyltransferase RsmD [Paenibacillus sp. UMB4589-SE434]